jgi:lipopolysaccharide transport system permease protein
VNGRALPMTRIRPVSGLQAGDLAQVWQFRDLLLAFAARDLKLRYRQTALGIAWVVLQPLIAAGIFSFVFGKIAKLDISFLSTYTGLLAWNAFSSTLTKASGCLVQNSGLISKVFFPRLVLPLSTLLATLVDFLVGLAVLAVLMVFYKTPPSFAILLMPLWLALILMLATGCGLYASALMVSYRDVQHMLPVIIPFLLYASPVAYPVSQVPLRYRDWYDLNPLSGLLDAFRWSLLGGGMPEWRAAGWGAAAALAALAGGIYAFKKMERSFADVI